MTEQKHTVATDALLTIGTLIDATAGRDAIHLAVEPVVAGHVLQPGQDVGLLDGKAVARKPYVGIVDPFLNVAVQEGQRFWLVVYPRQITSLRHVWEHPAFPAASMPAAEVITGKEASVAWMTEWALRNIHDGDYEYGTITREQALEMAIDLGYNRSVWSNEGARDHIDSEWWDHWEDITGQKGDRDDYFSCSC